MSKAYRDFKKLVKQMNEDPKCREHGYTPEKPTMRMFRRQNHFSGKFWKGTDRLSIYWTRKRNRKERLSKRDGWGCVPNPFRRSCGVWLYCKDGKSLGYVATSPQLDGWIGVQYRYKVGGEGMVQSLFNTRTEAQRWVEEILS